MSGRPCYRYSSAFKLKIVNEIESGKYTIGEARRIYDIKGDHTIQYWINQLGKNHLLSKVVRIQMKDEKDKIKELENQVKVLQMAFTQVQVDNICWKSLVEVIDEKYHIDSKKNFGPKLPPELQEVLRNLH